MRPNSIPQAKEQFALATIKPTKEIGGGFVGEVSVTGSGCCIRLEVGVILWGVLYSQGLQRDGEEG